VVGNNIPVDIDPRNGFKIIVNTSLSIEKDDERLSHYFVVLSLHYCFNFSR
jgi:hypothetical protein